VISTVELTNFVELESTDFTTVNDVTHAVSLEAKNLECGFQVTMTDDYGSTSYWEDCSFNGGLGSFEDWIGHLIDWLNS
jgi:hypothetical protein